MTTTWAMPQVLALIERMRAHRSDFTIVEVKRGAGGVPNFAATLCAFGNTPDGGIVIVGLDEHAGFAVAGVTVTFETLAIAGKQIVLAEVQGLRAHQRPSKPKRRAYLRQADGDCAMSAAEEQQLLA